MIADAHGIPLAVPLTGGNRNDVTQLMPLIAAIPPVRTRSTLTAVMTMTSTASRYAARASPQ
jgi:transposase